MRCPRASATPAYARAIIGEIGTSNPVHAREEKVLRAAARVSARTGVAVTLHTDPTGRLALDVLDILEAEGADPARVVVGHMDGELDDGFLEYHRRIVERGAYIAYDTFGEENCYANGLTNGKSFWCPSDKQRINAVLAAPEAGYGDRLLLSQDVCMKMSHEKYGGFGYGHLLKNIVPELRSEGVSQAELDQLLVDNPRKMLAH
ncbi:phosphotriesterase family protein [Prauserella endophytica]|uniref:Phosphotriesterase-related protein n=1 Tax=Prauserella endophytica TaxID=1592324 RepID=A0ABY2S4A0_9PSEU|nr:hypothetical protein [Prauserella endophytica]TKG70547.1 hypothetical protein FCN18_16830 [Prauserella endophytica]